MKMECMECGAKFSVSVNNLDPSCPKCHGVDVDINVERELGNWAGHREAARTELARQFNTSNYPRAFSQADGYAGE